MKTKTPQKELTAITVIPIDIDPKLPEVRREQILGKFVPLYEQIQEHSDEFAAITQADVTVFTSKLAKRAEALRKKLVTLRGKHGLKGAHTELKEDVKIEGQVIDLLERKPRELLLEWESKLEEIEKFQEREEARKIAELREVRLEQLQTYILDNSDPALETLGEISEQKWEEVFLTYRNAWEAEQEVIRLEALRVERLNTAKTYELYIDEFNEIVWQSLTEKQFKKIVSDAKEAHEKREQEAEKERQKAEEIRINAELAAQEAAERVHKGRVRAAKVTGAEHREDGLYYKGKKIANIKSLEEGPDTAFEQFLAKHLETYNADVAAEKARLEVERQAEIERAATQARIDAEAAAQRAAEEKARQESQEREDRLRKQKEEAQLAELAAKEAPDSDKLRELAERFASVEVPEFRTERGIEAGLKFKIIQEKWVAGLVKIASEMEK